MLPLPLDLAVRTQSKKGQPEEVNKLGFEVTRSKKSIDFNFIMAPFK